MLRTPPPRPSASTYCARECQWVGRTFYWHVGGGPVSSQLQVPVGGHEQVQPTRIVSPLGHPARTLIPQLFPSQGPSGLASTIDPSTQSTAPPPPASPASPPAPEPPVPAIPPPPPVPAVDSVDVPAPEPSDDPVEQDSRTMPNAIERQLKKGLCIHIAHLAEPLANRRRRKSYHAMFGTTGSLNQHQPSPLSHAIQAEDGMTMGKGGELAGRPAATSPGTASETPNGCPESVRAEGIDKTIASC